MVAASTSPCFVDSIWEIFGPLLAGVPMLIVPPSMNTNLKKLVAALEQHRVTHMSAVPTVWHAMLRAMIDRKQGLSLRQVVSSGEPLRWRLLADLRTALPHNCRILNLYGSTEVAADATALDCTDLQQMDGNDAVFVPVGLPLKGVIVALAALIQPEARETSARGTTIEHNGARRKNKLVLADPGEVGEVLVGGVGLAHGYVGDSGASQGKFLKVPLDELLASKSCKVSREFSDGVHIDEYGCVVMFATGDVGRWTANGGLAISGRKDFQIKVSGVRVDLLEVESVLSSSLLVEAAAVKPWETPTGQLGLVAYVVASSQPDTSPKDLQRNLVTWCAERLPHAAVPADIMVLSALPRTAAGKVDRPALPRPSHLSPPHAVMPFSNLHQEQSMPIAKRARHRGPFAAPSEVEAHGAFARALGHSSFEPTTSLFLAGGTSITAAAIADDLDIGTAVVLEHSSVRGIASYLQTKAQRQFTAVPSEGAAVLALPGMEFPALGEAGTGGLRQVWGAKMAQCVDARPAAANGKVFACSHGGDVACFAADTGVSLWRTALEGHADGGVALCQALEQAGAPTVAVTVSTGQLYFLNSETGDVTGSVDVSAGQGAPPVVDPWTGAVWVAGHSRCLTVALPPGLCLGSLPFPPIL